MTTITKKLFHQPAGRFVIAEDINEDGAKQFRGFKSIYELFPFIKAQPAKHFHEVMMGTDCRKLYFDADKKAGEGDFPDMAAFVSDMRECLTISVARLFGVELDPADICFTDSSTPAKFSAHVIVPSLNTTVESMKILYKIVSNAMNKMNPLYMNNNGRSILDPNIYKTNQTLRLLHCNKMGKDNTKKLWTSGFTELETVIGYLDDSKYIALRADIQAALDKRQADTTAARVNNMTKSPELFREIVMSLNPERADDYGDWSKICLTLGYEGAGLSIAMDFSRRSSKFNEAAVTRTYDRGTKYAGNRPATIGTLFHMLKQDNIAIFNKLMKAAAPKKSDDEASKIIDETEPNIYNISSYSHLTKVTHITKSPLLIDDIISWIHTCHFHFPNWENIFLALGREKMPIGNVLSYAKHHYAAKDPEEIKRLYDMGQQQEKYDIGTLIDLLAIDDEEFKQFDIIMTRHKANKKANKKARKYNIIDGEIKKRTSEQKLRKWLSNPKFFLYEKTNNPESALNEDDTIITYDERFMRPYPTNQPTIIAKAQKGGGKTHAIEQYIKEHNPTRILYLSFRRSFSNELMKRLGKYDFINYRDVEGPITNPRVVIQVESLHRIKWNEKCDLLIIDEIESIRGQFFAETCKLRTKVIDKYDMLLRTSSQVIAMDADISYNSIKLLRKSREGPVCYIENYHKGVQSQFEEYYTTKIDRLMIEICKALDAGQKIVIPTNRSIEFMESLRVTIGAKYPQLKIQMYNSATIRNKDTADELADVSKSWIKYDVLMYSPTVSAGVSFDEVHFDKCFCIFTNNGSINSMRQMISRVRKFSTNEYYYCLQPFGGSSKPTDIKGYERYICSNRYLNKPEFIMSKDNYDGSRQYPYKDTGYYLWLYSQVEKARDKNRFLFNFLCEQYYAGITNLNYMSEVTEKPAITDKQISDQKLNIKTINSWAIANAAPITTAEKADICNRLDKEQPISENERNSLIRRNLLDCYNLGERELTAVFVEVYNESSIKTAYHNRKALAAGLGKLMEDEARFFNAVCAGDDNGPSVQDDLDKKYKSVKMVIAKELLEITGFSGFYDTAEIPKETIYNNFKTKEEILIKQMDRICEAIGRAKRRRPNIKTWPENTYVKKMLEFVNSIIMDLFQLKIKQTGHRSGGYCISGIDKYNFEPSPNVT
jgi:hypothetical protein